MSGGAGGVDVIHSEVDIVCIVPRPDKAEAAQHFNAAWMHGCTTSADVSCTNVDQQGSGSQGSPLRRQQIPPSTALCSSAHTAPSAGRWAWTPGQRGQGQLGMLGRLIVVWQRRRWNSWEEAWQPMGCTAFNSHPTPPPAVPAAMTRPPSLP